MYDVYWKGGITGPLVAHDETKYSEQAGYAGAIAQQQDVACDGWVFWWFLNGLAPMDLCTFRLISYTNFFR